MDHLAIEIAGGLAVGASLGLVGAGGAIFTVPIFGVLLGHAPKTAIIEALAVTGSVAAAAGARAAWAREVDWWRVLLLGVPGVIGAMASAPLAKGMDAGLQVALFALVAAIAAWRMWSTARPRAAAVTADQSAAAPPRPRPERTIATGLGIGVLTSVLGVGGGFLLIPALVLLERLPMQLAIGTSLVVIALNSGSSVAGAGISGAIAAAEPEWRTVAIVAGFGIVGSLAGRAISERLPQRALRQGFALLLASVAVVMLVHHFWR